MRTTIWQQFSQMVPVDEERIWIKGDVTRPDYMENVPPNFPTCDRYVFAQGYCAGTIYMQYDPTHTFNVNLFSVMQRVAAAFERNPRANVVVIGSMSGIVGSYDPWYAASKAGLHCFVKTWRGLPREGRLNCVAPTIIRDSGMSERRHDRETFAHTRKTVSARQVAELCEFLLYHQHALNQTVIELPGWQIT